MFLDLDYLKGENQMVIIDFLEYVNGILEPLTLYVDFFLVLWEGNCL